jgi:Ni/Fe-hydrogenase subunit HybB-like protein
VMCLGFVMVDVGRPDRFWHLIPVIGKLNIPSSLLAWDVLALNGYLLLNIFIVVQLLYSAYTGKPYRKSLVLTLFIISIPAAISIHTITAFLYTGLAARPFWNASILAPRFLASAFCSGPAVLLILLQILKKVSKLEIKKEAIEKIAELMAYAMCINLFLLAAEVFKEYYSATSHLLYMKYMFSGLKGHNAIVPYMWLSVIFSLIAMTLFLIPRTRKNIITLNLGCFLIYVGVYLEKGMGLLIPGLTPDALGEIYEYTPSLTELQVAAGIFGLGFLIFTLLVKIAIPITQGNFTPKEKAGF